MRQMVFSIGQKDFRTAEAFVRLSAATTTTTPLIKKTTTTV